MKIGKNKILNVIIETPKGCRNKYKYDEKRGLFKLKKTLPLGTVFPFDFGFIPETKGGDGDPLDVLVMMDEPAYPGCMVDCRIIGTIKAEQKEKDGKKTRNDRIIAVAETSLTYAEIKKLQDMPQAVMDEIEHFFISYNEQEGKVFHPLGKMDVEETLKLIKKSKK
jgi:inorganic pyrophosphatase